jgi:hypothetical protein
LHLGKDADRFLVFGLLRREGLDAWGGLADWGFLNPDRSRQRQFPIDVLSPLVDGVAHDQHNQRNGDRAIFDGLVFVVFKERDPMFDFEGELISF